MSMYKQGNLCHVNIQAGETVYLCQCGQGNNSPYYDDSHREHPPAEALAHKTEQESTYVCDCGRSSSLPFCDSSHNEP